MKRFQIENQQYDTALIVSRSQIGNTLTTTVIRSEREIEPLVWNDLYEFGGKRFFPFEDKRVGPYDPIDYSEEYEQLINKYEDFVSAASFVTSDIKSPDWMKRNGELGAFLVCERFQESFGYLTIIDGNEQQATPFVRALSGYSNSETPPVCHCVMARQYYPTAFLGKVVARYITSKIESKVDGNDLDKLKSQWEQDLGIEVCIFHQDATKALGAVSSARAKSDVEYVPALEPGATEDFSEDDRIRSWYDGVVAKGDSGQTPSSSIEEILESIDEDEHPRLKTYLEFQR